LSKARLDRNSPLPSLYRTLSNIPRVTNPISLYSQELKAKHPNDFEILGFPCNQFGNQDPGSNDDIQSFCKVNYGVSFPVLGKIDVNGDKADPTFEWLKNEKPGFMGLRRVKWNFEKFLVGRDGKVKGRWASIKKPEDLKADIERELAKKK
jgi:glutathione peroxidase